MNGYHDRILKIDMDSADYRIEPVEEGILARYLGGKGLASYLLYTLNPPGVDPFSPDNHLIFVTGPATGSLVWGSSRYGVFTKSPLTGFYSESYSGGRVPEAVDAAGFDAIVILGQSPTPTVLEVNPQGAIFHPADDIWGMDTVDTERAVQDRFGKKGSGKQGICVIGPAGEKRVRFAAIQNDKWHSAGRTGNGAVMGDKKIKAILFRGDRRRPMAHQDRIRDMSKNLAQSSKDNPGVHAYKTLGTPMMVKITNTARCFPGRYWSQGTVEHWEKISAEALHSQCRVTPEACAKCFMACGRKTTISKGRHRGLQIKGPEYETIYAFGGLCLVESIEEIAFLNDLCNRLGMDTITTGNLCAFTMEAVSQGRVKYDLDYGNVDGIAQLIRKIADKKDLGEILSRGIKHAAMLWNMEDRAVHVKGLEPAGFDPRVLKGMGLAYAVADRGACHLRTTFYKPELSGVIPPEQIKDKADLLIDYEDRLTIFDTLILCRFFRDLYAWEDLVEMVSAITGSAVDTEALKKAAATITDQVRQFNLREGLTPKDDDLPEWFFHHRLEDGHGIKKEELHQLRSDYYRLRNWNIKN